MTRKSYIQGHGDDYVLFVLDQHAELDIYIYSAR
jgi:hypothetical protein